MNQRVKVVVVVAYFILSGLLCLGLSANSANGTGGAAWPLTPQSE